MASRTIENDRDRKMTIMTTTFVPCGAKLPIIALIAGALFNGASWVAPSAYFVGIAAIICSGIILKKTKLFAGDPAPFVMELPAYHWPTVSNVLRSMWERGWSFIKKAGTIILMSTIVLWFLMNFGWVDGSFGMLEAEQLNDSILASIGSVIAPLFAPLGWGDWKMAVAAVSGLIAKENVVGTFGILFGFGEVADKSLLRKQLPIIAETIYLLKKNGVISDNHNATLQNILKLEIEQYEIIISELWYTNAQCVLQTKIEEAIHLIVLSLLSNKVPFEETDNTRILSARIYRYLSRLDTPFSSQLQRRYVLSFRL